MSYQPAIGMRVVCIDQAPACALAKNPDVRFPEKGTVYTVSEVDAFPELYIGLAELEQEITLADGRAARPLWWYLHFRPLDERRIDVFRQMLAPAPQEMVPA